MLRPNKYPAGTHLKLISERGIRSLSLDFKGISVGDIVTVIDSEFDTAYALQYKDIRHDPGWIQTFIEDENIFTPQQNWRDLI